MKRKFPSEIFEILIVVQVIFIHIGIVVIVILTWNINLKLVFRKSPLVIILIYFTFWSIGTDTSDNRFLDLGPFASYVGWFVVVTSTSGCIFWVWNHLENFSTVLVCVIVATEIYIHLICIHFENKKMERPVQWKVSTHTKSNRICLSLTWVLVQSRSLLVKL